MNKLKTIKIELSKDSFMILGVFGSITIEFILNRHMYITK